MGLVSTTWNATQSNVATTIPYDGFVAGLSITLAHAVPAGDAFTFTVIVNGSATLLTCTVPAAGSTCTDTTAAHTTSFSAGQTVSLRATATGITNPAGGTTVNWISGL